MQELNDMNNLKHKSLCFRVRWEKNIKKIIAYNSPLGVYAPSLSLKINYSPKQSKMESKEFRIGNLLKYDDGTIVEVLTVSSRDIVVKRFPQPLNISVLHPIPLTPEILEKAGFYHSENWQKTWWFNKSISINFHNDKLYYNDMQRAIELQSVHQLQNLYFALTGEELEINLT